MVFSRTNDPGEAQYERYINLHLFRMLFMFMGLVLLVASCPSLYKQAPEQIDLTVV